jgi:ComF family protein
VFGKAKAVLKGLYRSAPENLARVGCRRKSGLGRVFDLLFPPVCTACRKPVAGAFFLCTACREKVRYLSSPLCERCGTLFLPAGGEDHICGDCLGNPPPFSMVRSVCLYAPPVNTLLHGLKYRADRTTLSALSWIAAPFDFAAFASADFIVPVPLHAKRLRQRGLNQSHLLARLFFPEKTDAIDPEILARVRDTLPQTGLDGGKRRKNLRAAFAVPEKKDLEGKRICVVDDVFTTGTTIRECAKVLIRAGAVEVRAVTMARVVEAGVAGRLPDSIDRISYRNKSR